MKWNILVIRRKETNKYFASTGEGMLSRSKRINFLFEECFEIQQYKVIVLYFYKLLIFLSKVLNVYLCLNRVIPFTKPKYTLSNR